MYKPDSLQPAADLVAPMAARIAGHLAFPAVVLHYAESLLEWRADATHNRNQSATHTRSQIIGYLVSAHFAADPTNPDDGATYAKILALCRRRDDCSPRALKTLLALLRLGRYVSVRRGHLDRRLRIYQPTEKLLAFMRDWYTRTFTCFDLLDAGRKGYGARVRDDPAYLPYVFTAISPPYIEQDILLVRFFPELFALFEHHSGFIIAAVLAQSASSRTSILTPQAIAKSYFCSASQVRGLLADLAARGLVTLDAASIVDSSSPIVRMFQGHVARELSLYATFALDDLDLEPRADPAVSVERPIAPSPSV